MANKAMSYPGSAASRKAGSWTSTSKQGAEPGPSRHRAVQAQSGIRETPRKLDVDLASAADAVEAELRAMLERPVEAVMVAMDLSVELRRDAEHTDKILFAMLCKSFRCAR